MGVPTRRGWIGRISTDDNNKGMASKTRLPAKGERDLTSAWLADQQMELLPARTCQSGP